MIERVSYVKKILISSCLLLLLNNPQIMKIDKIDKQILIVSEKLPQVFIATLRDDKSYDVVLLPNDTRVNLTCMENKSTKLSNFKLNDVGKKCMVDSLNNNFDMDIDNYVILDFDKITTDFKIDTKNNQLESFDNILKIFKEVAGELNVSIIMNYSKYIDTNLNVGDLYNLYQSYSKGKVTIHYYYPYLIYSQGEWIPLDKSLYKK